MKVFRNIGECKISNPVITLGSFDGVHLGHIKVLHRLKEIANELNGESVIFTFSPHPRQVLYPNEDKIMLLNTEQEKIELLEDLGIDNIILYPFTKEFAKVTYTEFVRNILIGELNMKSLVVGYDHRFGSNREGDFEHLLELSSELNFSIERENVFNRNDENVSSTKIRNALLIGDVVKANDYLGYNYNICGKVIPGEKLGRKIGFPTANIQIDNEFKIIPASGVYAVSVFIKNTEYNGMLNIGMRPTVSDEGLLSIEVNIFDFNQEIYGEKIKVAFTARIRGERKFENIQELKSQLESDRIIALNYKR